MSDTNHISLTYSESEFRSLIEEYMTRQKKEFTFNGLCSYIACWAMEVGMKMEASKIFFESNKLRSNDQNRVRRILDSIIRGGRITASCETYYKA